MKNVKPLLVHFCRSVEQNVLVKAPKREVQQKRFHTSCSTKRPPPGCSVAPPVQWVTPWTNAGDPQCVRTYCDEPVATVPTGKQVNRTLLLTPLAYRRLTPQLAPTKLDLSKLIGANDIDGRIWSES